MLIDTALSADRVTLENTKVGPYHSIPELDRSDMTYFFDQLYVVLPTLGVDMFSPVRLRPSASIGANDPVLKPSKNRAASVSNRFQP